MQKIIYHKMLTHSPLPAKINCQIVVIVGLMQITIFDIVNKLVSKTSFIGNGHKV